MNFKSIILKNLKSSIRYYLAYFLCIALSISFFFILVNLLNDFNLKTAFGAPGIFEIIVSIPLFVLGVFSIFFISYVNSNFIKKISKELGLYLALGMDKRKVSIIVFLQNITIGSVATVFGLLIGTIFSRLFFIIILEIMDLSNIPFGLHLKSYIYTLLMFLIIFVYMLIKSLFITKKLEVNELLKESRKKEDIAFKSPVWGIIGIILMVISFIVNVKYVHVKSLGQVVFFSSIAVTLIGLNLFLSQIHNITSFISKRNKTLWYKNLLFNTNLHHRISSNKKFIFALSISYFIMFLFGIMSYHEHTRIEVVAKKLNPYDLAYVDIGNNKISNTTLDEIIKKQNISITKEETLQFLEMSMESKSTILINDENYNKAFNKSLKLSKGNAILLGKFSSESNYEETINVKSIINYDKDFEKSVLGEAYCFKVQDVQYNWNISHHPYLQKKIYLISKEDFYEIAKDKNSNLYGLLHLYNLNDWKKGYEIENTLNKLPQNKNSKLFYSVGGIEPKYVSKGFSTMGEIKKLKSQHGLILFLFSFICLIFFVSSGSLVYYRYFSQLENDKRMYKKLMRIGISNKEVEKMIGKDMIFIFFIPCIIGALIGFMYLYSFYSSYQKANLLIVSLQFIGICLIFQTIYYLITKRRVYQEVINYIKG